MTLNRVGVLSCGKICGLLYALLGLIVGFFVSLVTLAVGALGLAANGPENAIIGMLFGVGAVAILPVVYGVAGFVGGVVSAFLYNLLARMVGGIELELS